jgi:hypothetical protein
LFTGPLFDRPLAPGFNASLKAAAATEVMAAVRLRANDAQRQHPSKRWFTLFETRQTHALRFSFSLWHEVIGL